MNETQASTPWGYTTTNNGTDSMALVAALKTNPLDEVTAQNTSDLKLAVWQAEADAQKAIQVLTNLINANNLNLHNRLCESEKASIESKFEGRLETKDAVVKLTDKIDHCCEESTEAINSFEKSVSDKFCDLERRIDSKFCDLRERELQAEISALKVELAESAAAAQTGNITSAVVAALKASGVIK